MAAYNKWQLARSQQQCVSFQPERLLFLHLPSRAGELLSPGIQLDVPCLHCRTECCDAKRHQVCDSDLHDCRGAERARENRIVVVYGAEDGAHHDRDFY